MEKSEFADGVRYEWPRLAPFTARRNGRKRRDGEKETTEEMIRSLQGVFCKGRYRSWLLRTRD